MNNAVLGNAFFKNIIFQVISSLFLLQLPDITEQLKQILPANSRKKLLDINTETFIDLDKKRFSRKNSRNVFLRNFLTSTDLVPD